LSRENNFLDSDLERKREREREREGKKERKRERERVRERRKERERGRERGILARPMGFAHFCWLSQLPTTSFDSERPKKLAR